jgi:hypothetical protein
VALGSTALDLVIATAEKIALARSASAAFGFVRPQFISALVIALAIGLAVRISLLALIAISLIVILHRELLVEFASL